MKRALKLTVFVLATLIFFAETALAADFTREAGYLLSLGVIRETNGGCALNRAPTRLEAAVLISRLLSGGGDLKKEAANSPFIDVPTWARPDIGFLYKKGVIKGASKSFFEPYADATPDMCLTLLLRALGYGGENGGFGAAGPKGLSEQIGLIDAFLSDELRNSAFSRGDMMALSFSALSCKIKDDPSGRSLLDLWTEKNKSTEASDKIKNLFAVRAAVNDAVIKTAAVPACEVKTSASLQLIPGGVYTENEVKSKNQNEECQKTLPFGPGRIKTYNETARGDNKEITLTVDGPPPGFNPELISRVSPEDCEKTFGDLNFTFVIDKDGFLIEQKLSFDLLFVSNGQKKYGIYEESKALLTEEKIDSHENRESEQNKTARPE